MRIRVFCENGFFALQPMFYKEGISKLIHLDFLIPVNNSMDFNQWAK